VQPSSTILQAAITQIQTIANSSVFGNNTCAQCLAGMEIAKFVAMAAPSEGPALAVALCEYFDYSSDCAKTYGNFDFGTVLTQVISYADAGGLDGQVVSLSDLPSLYY
jgi:sphingomyelin phosphodiesterase